MSLEFAKINTITFLCHETFYPKFIVFYLEHTFNFFLLFFNWRKIAPQYWVGFHCITTGISRNQTHFPSFLSSLPLWVITEREAGLSVLCSNFSPAVDLTHESVHMLLSPLVTLPPSPPVSTRPFSKSAPPFLPCKQLHQYRFLDSTCMR